MGTNPIGSGTRNLSVNVPIEVREELEKLAAASGLTLSQYIRLVLGKAVQSETVYRIEERPPAVSSEPSKPTKVAEERLRSHVSAARARRAKRES